ncbi:MAG: DUF58 domain-containing protein [Planctomycetota bacterium]
MATAPGVHVDLKDLVRLEAAARGFGFRPRQPVGSVLSGRHGSRLRGRGLTFEEHREYVPGDDVRSIDWRVTARTRRTHVRVHSEERDRPVLLVVDQRQTMFFGTRRTMKSVVAAEAAALAAWRVVASGDRVGAVVVGEERVETVRPRRSRSTVERILGLVARENQSLAAGGSTEAGEGRLIEALRYARAVARTDSLVVVVSDFAGDPDETRRLLGQLAASNDVVLGFVYDTSAANLPRAGRIVFTSGELQAEIDTEGERVRRSVQSDFEERLEAVRGIARRHGLPALALETGEDVATQLRVQLGGFAARGR